MTKALNMFYETDSMTTVQRKLALALSLPNSTKFKLLRKIDDDKFLKIGKDTYESLDKNNPKRGYTREQTINDILPLFEKKGGGKKKDKTEGQEEGPDG